MDDGPRTSDATRESGRTLAQEIIEAYGGMKRWNRVSSLRVDIAFAGFAFRMKFLRNLRIEERSPAPLVNGTRPKGQVLYAKLQQPAGL